MEYCGIVHFQNKNYCFALEKGKFLFRLETKKGDMEKVILHFQDKYIRLEWKDTRTQVEMKKVRSDSFKDYFEAVIEIDVICLRYFFELCDTNKIVSFFGNHEFFENKITDIECMFDCPQNLREEEIFSVPQWAKNKVVYQIFPSRFATDKEIPYEEWYKVPIDSKTNLKGNLRGIINRLNYLKDLGIDIIYLNPIFQSKSSHKYDTDDYYKIDSDFGTKEELKELVQKAHSLGLRVILDAVFNHTSDDFFAFQDVKKNEKNSKYLNWYYIKDFPIKKIKNEKPNYLTFAYVGFMPKLNLSNPEVQNYFIDVAKYWVKECNIDGWRLDVGDEISHSFWKRFRSELKSVNKDLLIIGEIWHFAGDFLEGDEWDSVMNYQFYRSVLELVANESISVSKFIENQNFLKGHLNPNATEVLWNLMGSHDTERFLSICDGNIQKLKLAAAIMLLHKGMPVIYYGDEVGMEGGMDPDCRRGMIWDEKLQNKEVLQFYKRLLQLRHELKIITNYQKKETIVDDKNGILIEKLFSNENPEDKITFIFNCKNEAVSLLDSDFIGKKDLITNSVFNGKIKSFEVVVLV